MLSFFKTIFGQQKSGFAKADAILKKLVRKKQVPGIAITITKNGETRFSKGYGFSDVETKTPVEPSKTIFRIGSVSKPIAASCLAKLVAKHKISLTDTLHSCLPEFSKEKYSFTLKQLGGHLAGIRNYKGNEFMNSKPLSIEEGVALFKNDPLLFQPGQGYSYTSYSWNLLSLALQNVEQKPFEAIVDEEVLRPLGLTHTYPDKQNDISDLATFYKKSSWRRFVKTQPVNNYFKLAGGGYLSTSEDVAELGNAYLDESFLPKEVIEEFTSSQMVNDKPTYYGIGWQTSYDHQKRPYFGHIGNGYGGYGIFYVYPKDRIVVSILMNCSNPNKTKKFEAVIDAVFEEFEQDTSMMSSTL